MNFSTKFIHLTLVSLLIGSVTAYGKWETDYKKAIATATDESKHILLEFTGSDWCPPCIMLKKDIFEKNTFKEYAEQNLVLIEIDFPRKKNLDKLLSEQNDQLLEKYEVRGFPTIVILDPRGKEITRHVGYKPGGVENYLRYIESSIASF